MPLYINRSSTVYPVLTMVCAFNALRMVLELLPITHPYLQSYHNNSSQLFIVIAIYFLIKCGNQRTKCHDREIDDISKDA